MASSKVSELEGILGAYQGKRLLTVCRGPPDPDFIGAAYALDLLARRHGIQTRYLSTAPVGHIQNRMELQWLGIDVALYPKIDLGSFDGFVVLDAHGVDRKLIKDLKGLPWVAMIDHHDPQLNGSSPGFLDIRQDVGSTCTILSSYLQELDFLKKRSLHKRAATALDFGIRVDTTQCRLATPADYEALRYLHPFRDDTVLNRLLYQSTTPRFMDCLFKAWTKRVKSGNYVLSGVGSLRYADRDAIAYAAQQLIQIRGVDTSLVYALVGDSIQGSLRTCDSSVRPKRFLEWMLPGISELGGDLGGHVRMGGFSIPVKAFHDLSKHKLRGRGEVWEYATMYLTQRFYHALGMPCAPASSGASE